MKTSENRVFIRTLVDLARTFGLETVTECVETEEEAGLLLNEGVHYVQGQAFGKPDLTVPWKARNSQPALNGFGILENRENQQGSEGSSLPG